MRGRERWESLEAREIQGAVGRGRGRERRRTQVSKQGGNGLSSVCGLSYLIWPLNPFLSIPMQQRNSKSGRKK